MKEHLIFVENKKYVKDIVHFVVKIVLKKCKSFIIILFITFLLLIKKIFRVVAQIYCNGLLLFIPIEKLFRLVSPKLW